MIERLQVTNVRGIGSGCIDGMKAVNVFIGPNNSGKSTLLDALYLGTHKSPKEAFSSFLNKRRAIRNGDRWFIHRVRGEAAGEATIEVTNTEGFTRTLHIDGTNHVGHSVRVETPQTVELQKLETAFNQKNSSAQASKNREEKAALRAEANKLQELIGTLRTETQKQTSGKEPFPGTPEVRLIEPATDEERPLHDLMTFAAERGLKKEVSDLGSVVKLQIRSPTSWYSLCIPGPLPDEDSGLGTGLGHSPAKLEA